MAYFLELNDWQLRLINESGDVEYDQPAAAAASANGLVFGLEAQASARTHPQHFCNQFVSRLNADPLPTHLHTAKNHADLIYHYLYSLNVADELVISVPSHVTNQQLGLLLGIAKEADLTVKGFVDSSLAYCLDLPLAATASLLDIEMHRAVLTEIGTDASERRINSSKPFDALGSMGIVDGWLNVIADEFVQRTRFDPLHAAATEQQLLDMVISWLTDTALNDQQVVVNSGEQSRDIDVSAEMLRAKLAQRLDTIDLTNVSQLVITPRVQRVPGLQTLLGQRVSEVITTTDLGYTNALLRLSERLPSDQIERISTASASAQPTTDPAVKSAASATRATHLLLGSSARSIESSGFHQHIDDRGNARHGVVVNDQAGDDIPILAGDRVVLNGQTYLAITVD